MSRLFTLVLLTFALTFAASADEPHACKTFNTRLSVPVDATAITLADIRYCRFIVTLKARGTRYWRLESLHKIIVVPLDNGCQWWTMSGGGVYAAQKQAKQVRRQCRFRVHIVRTTDATFEQWRIRIVETRGIE